MIPNVQGMYERGIYLETAQELYNVLGYALCTARIADHHQTSKSNEAARESQPPQSHAEVRREKNRKLLASIAREGDGAENKNLAELEDDIDQLNLQIAKNRSKAARIRVELKRRKAKKIVPIIHPVRRDPNKEFELL